jgi:hypothetical protein
LVRQAETSGFRLERTLHLPLGRIGKLAQTEPLFVFLKS